MGTFVRHLPRRLDAVVNGRKLALPTPSRSARNFLNPSCARSVFRPSDLEPTRPGEPSWSSKVNRRLYLRRTRPLFYSPFYLMEISSSPMRFWAMPISLIGLCSWYLAAWICSNRFNNPTGFGDSRGAEQFASRIRRYPWVGRWTGYRKVGSGCPARTDLLEMGEGGVAYPYILWPRTSRSQRPAFPTDRVSRTSGCALEFDRARPPISWSHLRGSHLGFPCGSYQFDLPPFRTRFEAGSSVILKGSDQQRIVSLRPQFWFLLGGHKCSPLYSISGRSIDVRNSGRTCNASYTATRP